MQTNMLSRRKFLKVAGLGLAAVGATVCGVGLGAPAPPEEPVVLPSETLDGLAGSKRVLLAYASMFGSTAEIAQAIAATLVERGFSVDLRPVLEKPAVQGYDAVLVGSAIQYGKWLPEGIDFLKANQAALARLPLGLFCVHITNTDDSPASAAKRRGFLDEARALVKPSIEAAFAGKFDRRGAAKLMPGFLARLMPTWDLRKWDQIQGWAQGVFDYSSARPAQPPVNFR